ncbi:type II toxin-antitoxin system ParD family antitoxin [Nitrosomonas sp.]|uniref:type II toxin-antitoxin system ParD family antitoxin n=1 Tax=Nitrosomonas sp. TaxID=42353 RepID=UPI001DAC4F89|nr:type II toxin-antitoxin system ParD family antitoxin [Nitrosomonas sp.]MCB1948408.1 type II toxin-antitoxin system ParD family antitoxin [Nitrosomonas sp.]
MPRNTSITLGKHFSDFIDEKIKAGRFESTSEAVRAGLRLLEADEAKLDVLRSTLSEGKAQIDRGEAIDGEQFMTELTSKYE